MTEVTAMRIARSASVIAAAARPRPGALRGAAPLAAEATDCKPRISLSPSTRAHCPASRARPGAGGRWETGRQARPGPLRPHCIGCCGSYQFSSASRRRLGGRRIGPATATRASAPAARPRPPPRSTAQGRSARRREGRLLKQHAVGQLAVSGLVLSATSCARAWSRRPIASPDTAMYAPEWRGGQLRRALHDLAGTRRSNTLASSVIDGSIPDRPPMAKTIA